MRAEHPPPNAEFLLPFEAAGPQSPDHPVEYRVLVLGVQAKEMLDFSLFSQEV